MATREETRPRLRSIFGGSIGNLVEYYDWYVYSAFALYFAKVFFPEGDPTAQLLNTAAIFAVGFLMRPIGGWLLGRYADRRGRKAALLVSVLAMCGGSLIIALTPGYAAIGAAAPALLLVARLLQGLSLGGEYASSATYLSEIAPPRSRGFWSSFLFATLSLGQLLALGVLVLLQAILTAEQLEAWGWRIPFLIGAAAALVAVVLRRSMTETDNFRAHEGEARARSSWRELWRHRRACLLTAGITLGGTVSFYGATTYMQKFLVTTSGMSRDTASATMALALCLFVAMQPLFGALSDRIGRRAMLIGFGVLGTLLTVPIFSALAAADAPAVALPLVVALLAIVSLYSSVSAVVKAELFPVTIRALGVGLPYALTVSIFGGSAEYVAFRLKAAGHEPVFYWYVTGCVAVSLVCYLGMRETRDRSAIDRD